MADERLGATEHAMTVAPGRRSVDWCRRCNLSRVQTQLVALTAAGVVPLGHVVECGCYR